VFTESTKAGLGTRLEPKKVPLNLENTLTVNLAAIIVGLRDGLDTGIFLEGHF
jgi:hypothetical protein